MIHQDAILGIASNQFVGLRHRLVSPCLRAKITSDCSADAEIKCNPPVSKPLKYPLGFASYISPVAKRVIVVVPSGRTETNLTPSVGSVPCWRDNRVSP